MYAQETNPVSPSYQKQWAENLDQECPEVDWSEPGLKITRLRLLTDPGFPVWDVSYCDGRLPNGKTVMVRLPFSQLPKRGVVKAIIEYAKRDKVFAKGTGIFDCVSKLW